MMDTFAGEEPDFHEQEVRFSLVPTNPIIPSPDGDWNSRIGSTFSLPLTQHQSIKLAWAKGVTTRIGGNLHIVAVGWQYSWF
jgi:hypothetical protein